eukprot:TRINITY_DN7680_c0_g2_i1.p1 TRINITY_DN7680_c0_g2~~TRINITY_DN7680_c0_g2_i1.p1  ORF type:complete len:132 (+),score=16.95 TRINITY_DN7680_c0_g2_i1:281-676(+)
MKKLCELQERVKMNPVVLQKWKLANDDSYLRVAEILEILQKNKIKLPDICCLHCPKLRRLLMKNSEFLNMSLQDLNENRSHKHPSSFMVCFGKVNRKEKVQCQNRWKHYEQNNAFAAQACGPNIQRAQFTK